MPIHGTGSRRSLLNSPTPSEQGVYSVALVFSPVNATDPLASPSKLGTMSMPRRPRTMGALWAAEERKRRGNGGAQR
jgi:hypothetical protein